MDVAGLALGAVSLLAGFKGAVDGYELLVDWSNAFEGSSYLTAKHKIEQQRLSLWGDYFGFNDKDCCSRLVDRQPEATVGLVLYILAEVRSATTDVDKLMGKYGLRLADNTSAIADVVAEPAKLRFQSPALDAVIEWQREQQAKLSVASPLRKLRKGLQWTLDLPRFEKLLDHLEYLNDSLERLVPRVDLTVLGMGLPSYLLPPAFTDESLLPTYKESSQQYLAACAAANEIKNLDRLGRQQHNVPLFKLGKDLKAVEAVNKIVSKGSHRLTAIFTNGGSLTEVVIDWKEPNPTLSPHDRDEVEQRIRNLSQLFRTVSLSHFRVLPCLGLVEDPEYADLNPGHKKLGFVFTSPYEGGAAQPKTLLECFADSTTIVGVGTRFRLAQSLAGAMLLLHSSRWLHKNLRSENVVVFPRKSADSGADDVQYLLSPYFMGFGYSRPDQPGAVSIERRMLEQVDLYRHPRWREGYNRYCDIYSLGVILFEIGHWKSVADIKRGASHRMESEGDTQNFLAANSSRNLKVRMGEVYAKVTHRCLTGDFQVDDDHQDGALVRAFWSLVVKELDSCRA
jgi:hypothetical protein